MAWVYYYMVYKPFKKCLNTIGEGYYYIDMFKPMGKKGGFIINTWDKET